MQEFVPYIDKCDLKQIKTIRKEIIKYEGLLQEALLKKTEAYYAIEHGYAHQDGGVVINVKNYRTADMKQEAKNKRIIEYEEAEAHYQDIAGVLLGCYLYFACLDFLDHHAYLRVLKNGVGRKMLTAEETRELEYFNLIADRRKCMQSAHKALEMRKNLLTHDVSEETKQRFIKLSKEIRVDMHKRRKYYHRKFTKKDRNKEFIEL